MESKHALGLAFQAFESDDESNWPPTLGQLKPYAPIDSNVHWIFLPLLHRTDLMDDVLALTHPMELSTFESMICRCIERKLGATLHLLMRHGLQYGLKATLRLLPKYLPFDAELYQMAKAHGHRDLAYEGHASPPFEEDKYVGYRIAYHSLFYRQHLRALIRHWETHRDDCTYHAAEDYLKLDAQQDNHDIIVRLMIRLTGLPSDLSGISNSWWLCHTMKTHDDFRIGLRYHKRYDFLFV